MNESWPGAANLLYRLLWGTPGVRAGCAGWRSMRTRVRETFLCVALLGAFPAAAYGQPAPESIEAAKEAARIAADKGQEHFDAGRYKEAIAAFRDADQKFHAPTIQLMIARAHEKLGQLREARAQYQQVVDEKLALYAPRPFFQAQLDAKKEMEALIPRIPTLQVTVKGAPAADVQLTVDGRTATVGEALPLDPGEHAVVATAPDGAQATQQVKLEERARKQIALVLQPPPTAQPSQPTASAEAEGSPPARGYVVPALAAFGVAGLGIGIGAITGGLTLSKGSELRKDCPDRVCYDDSGGDTYDSVQTLGAVSTVSFVVGGVAAAAGVALLLWPRSDAGAQVGMVVGPGWTGVRGVF